MNEVLQKIIAERSSYSRRQAEVFIRQGKVMVNGKIAKLGDRANLDTRMTVGGRELKLPAQKIYIMLNKPKGYTCTNRTFKAEKNIFELVRINEKLFAVGRLDKDSHGLILLTNDGELTQKLAHPRYGSQKEYEVIISEDADHSRKLMEGMNIGEDDGFVKADKAKYLGNRKYSIILSQGKKRQIRRMFGAIGVDVLDLKRVKLSNLELGTLPEGKWRELTPEEVKRLKK
ncbi:MAG TPA: pseudouridine synthase [bacterium]|nr:pseudouridine synthase [bacterium]HPT29488.1 pseudouridine synthase [bacterium]